MQAISPGADIKKVSKHTDNKYKNIFNFTSFKAKYNVWKVSIPVLNIHFIVPG